MAAPSKTKKPARPSELVGLIPKLGALPGEDTVQMADLRQALLMDLSPSTPYEHTIAEQLFSLEWEAARHRRLRDALIVAEVRQRSMGVFHCGEVDELCWTDDNQDAENLGYDLVSNDPERMQGALEKLAEREISPDEVIAKAYIAMAKDLDLHDRQIADIERRRRRLRNDFERLKSLRARPIEDAILLDDK